MRIAYIAHPIGGDVENNLADRNIALEMGIPVTYLLNNL